MNTTTPGSAAFSSLFPDFKIVTGYDIGEKAVTGWCEIYKQRTDKENEYAIRELGVALIPQDGTLNNQMVMQAIEAARSAAMATMSTLLNVTAGAPAPAPSPTTEVVGCAPAPPPQEAPAEPPVKPDEPVKPAEPATEPPPVEDALEKTPKQEEAADDGEGDGNNGDGPDEGDNPIYSLLDPPDKKQDAGPLVQDNISRVGFSPELFPASQLVGKQTAPPAPPPDPEPEEPPKQEELPVLPQDTGGDDADADDEFDAKIKQAREVLITILGKANDYNGWPAGRILDEHPDVIINMFQRWNGKYTGHKADQMDAVETLYPEALRKMKNAA